MSAADDVTRQAELVILDYLKSQNCPQAFNALTDKLSALDTSITATERFSIDLKARKKDAKNRSSVLEYLVSINVGRKSTSFSQQLDPTSPDSEIKTEMYWTSDEIYALKKAIKSTSPEVNKNARWKEIAVAVGNNKTKKHCYLKYKELKQERVNATSKKASPRHKSSSSKSKNTDENITSVSKSDRERTEGFKITSFEDVDLSSKASTSTSNFVDEVSPHLAVSRPPVATEPDSTLRSFETLEIEDCEDMEVGLCQFTTGQAQSSRPSSNGGFIYDNTKRALTSSDNAAVQRLLFGSSKNLFGSHWNEQGFVFSTVRDLQYGLVQHQGGPCGVLAVVQGYVLRFLLLEACIDWKNPGVQHQESSLVQALAHILWQAASASQFSECVVAVKHNATARQRTFMADLELHVATSEMQTRHIIAAHLRQFMDAKGAGIVQFVLSVLLTKGVEMIYSEMDQLARDTGGQLIGAHDYCTQELVNLLLCGYARSNVFDGDQALKGTDASDTDALVLRGIPKQSVLGFLSLFEAYQNLVVGSFYKNPRVNIWVICSESHYSVLFAADPQALNDRTFDIRSSVDLLYYDGLANQDEEIRLTVNTLALIDHNAAVSHNDLIPPLDLVIRTKWAQAAVDWNGIEPLL